MVSGFVAQVNLHLVESHVWSKFNAIGNQIFYACFDFFIAIIIQIF